MDIITFKKESYVKTFTFEEKPSISVNTLSFITNDNEWKNRIYPGIVVVEFQNLNENGESLGYSKDPIALSTFISKDRQQPTLVLNKTPDSPVQVGNYQKLSKWKISITLQKIELLDGERINLSLAGLK